MTTTAAIYCRISRDKKKDTDDEGLGVERQEQDCRKLAKRLGWKVQNVYVDNDISAYSGKRRPGYQALLTDIEQGRVAGVLAWHPDRLHRSPKELERYIELSEKHSVVTHTVQAGKWDLSTPSGRAVARTLGAWARYESEHRGARIAASCAQRAVQKGGWHGGRRCYGWQKDGVTPRESEAAELRKAAEQIAIGVSLRAVVADMNAREVSTTNGRKPWDSTTLRETLISPRHAGFCSYRDEIVGEAEWPAIIAPDLWHTVHRILTDPARRTNHVGGTVKWLGSGIYRCGVCGSQDVRVGTTEGRKRYRCRNRVKGDPATHVGRDAQLLDAYVEAAVVARLSKPAVLDALRPPAPEVDVPGLRNELSEKRMRLSEAAELFAAGSITAVQLAAITATLRSRIETIEGRLASGAADNPLTVFSTTDDIAAAWYGPGGPNGDRSGGLALGARREVLRALVDVTILPAPSGRSSDGAYFRPDCVRVEWR